MKNTFFWGEKTFVQNFLKILITSRYIKNVNSQMITKTFVEEIKHIIT